VVSTYFNLHHLLQICIGKNRLIVNNFGGGWVSFRLATCSTFYPGDLYDDNFIIPFRFQTKYINTICVIWFLTLRSVAQFPFPELSSFSDVHHHCLVKKKKKKN
jgi:hypothetical protein